MMMGFNRDVGIRFHYDENELQQRGLSEESIQVLYLDSNFNWQPASGAILNTEANTIFVNDSNVRTFYSLRAGTVTSVEDQLSTSIPEEFTLLPNFPNPFNPQTTIRYLLKKDLDISLTVYDIQGREVKQLFRGKQQAGEYSTVWDGKNEAGRLVASGVYLIDLSAGAISRVQKVTLLK